jgi:hypothetical protein
MRSSLATGAVALQCASLEVAVWHKNAGYNLQRRHLLAAQVYERVLAAGERTPIVFLSAELSHFQWNR